MFPLKQLEISDYIQKQKLFFICFKNFFNLSTSGNGCASYSALEGTVDQPHNAKTF